VKRRAWLVRFYFARDDGDLIDKFFISEDSSLLAQLTFDEKYPRLEGEVHMEMENAPAEVGEDVKVYSW